jgi:parvulin-like peptidyl-prolyl isomerase
MVKEFDQVCFGINEATGMKYTTGTVHGPIKSEFGYHLIMIESRDEEKKAQ